MDRWASRLVLKKIEPVYRLAEQEWKDFVEALTTIMVDEVDSQIPHLPPKDYILRIYRDVRLIFIVRVLPVGSTRR
jgi:hypothetical protein